MDNGNEVIAKTQCPNAGPPSMTTASEVATLKFLRSRTSIRVPRIIAWSSDANNSVGAEFIIMERIRGVALADRWDAMDTLERYKIIDQVVQVEKELGSISFPAYGSLFLRTCRQYPLPLELDPEELFCIEPSCKRTWWHGNFVGRLQSVSKDIGPWTHFTEYALSIVQRELAHIASSETEVQRQLHNFDESQSIDEYQSLLEKVKMVLPILSQEPCVTGASEPVLWQPSQTFQQDLHFRILQRSWQRFEACIEKHSIEQKLNSETSATRSFMAGTEGLKNDGRR